MKQNGYQIVSEAIRDLRSRGFRSGQLNAKFWHKHINTPGMPDTKGPFSLRHLKKRFAQQDTGANKILPKMQNDFSNGYTVSKALDNLEDHAKYTRGVLAGKK